MKKIFQTRLAEGLRQFKDSTAIEYGNKTFTYNDVDKQSNGIANWIIDKGIKKESFIGIYTVDRVRLINAIIGILKAGCVFVPLDPALPKARLETMIREAELKRIIMDEGQTWNREAGVEAVSFEELFASAKPRWYLEEPHVNFTPEDKIYVYFTSGSTGIPRAIVGKNKSLFHFIDWEIETFAISPGYRISQWITPGFDAFLRDVFVALCSGGTLCIPQSSGILLNPEELIQWTDSNKINLIHCVPGLFRQLLSNSLTSSHFSALKYVLLSGEQIDVSSLVNWYDTFGGRIRLVNFYGPTETTMIKTYHIISRSDLSKERIPIGVPMKGARVIILDEEMNICDELITGEIYIRTPYRTFGYYNDERANREKFIPNPLSIDPHDIVFRTGDLGRFLPDGTIEFLGRKDRQVKIRGVRVELEEIEHALLNHPEVLEAAVVKKEIDHNQLLCAYITVNQKFCGGPGGGFSKEPPVKRVPAPRARRRQIKEYLDEILPVYMVPGSIDVLESMPRKPNGKIDYDALPDPLEELDSRYIPPADKIQEKLIETWHEILGLEDKKIGIKSSFFRLGGNSLNILSLISLIHREFQVKLSLGEFFEKDTVEKQAQLIEASVTDVFTSIPPAPEKSYYPVSSVQRRLFFLQQVEKENKSYNMPRVLLLEGTYDIPRLEKTLGRMIQRHESLRTSFRLIEEDPVMEVHAPEGIVFEAERYDLDQLEGEAIDDGALREILAGFVRPFDLGCPPLMRAGFIRIDRRRLAAVLDFHHIISDGISEGIFITEFMALYRGEELPSLQLQYKDFSVWQNSGEQRQSIKKQEAYWLHRFSGEIPLLDLPADFARPRAQTFEGGIIAFDIGVEQTRALKTAAIEEDVTLYMMLLALFNVFLSCLTGKEDIIVGTSLAGRGHPDLDGIIGMFVNALALRNYPAAEKTFREFLKEVRRNILADFDNQDYQFENLVEKVSVTRVPGRNPIFDVMMVMNNEELLEIEIPGVTLRPYGYEKKSAQMDLKFRSLEEGENLYCSFEYSTKLFKRETIDMFTGNFKEVVEQVLANRDIRLEEVAVTHGLQSTNIDTSHMSFEF